MTATRRSLQRSQASGRGSASALMGIRSAKQRLERYNVKERSEARGCINTHEPLTMTNYRESVWLIRSIRAQSVALSLIPRVNGSIALPDVGVAPVIAHSAEGK